MKMTRIVFEEPDPEGFAQAVKALSHDPARAIAEFKSLADKGSVSSIIKLGNAYQHGRHGVPVSDAEAERYYLQASKVGALLADYCLGRLYLDRKNFADAFATFEAAARKGYAPTAHYLGRMYFFGIGIPQDLKRAKMWLEIAVRRQSIPAKMLLGRLLMRDIAHPRQAIRGLWLFLTAFADLRSVMRSEEGNANDRLL